MGDLLTLILSLDSFTITWWYCWCRVFRGTEPSSSGHSDLFISDSILFPRAREVMTQCGSSTESWSLSQCLYFTIKISAWKLTWGYGRPFPRRADIASSLSLLPIYCSWGGIAGASWSWKRLERELDSLGIFISCTLGCNAGHQMGWLWDMHWYLNFWFSWA